MKKALIVLLLLVVGVVIFIATRPGSYHIERSASIAAPPEVVFANINDFHRWSAWSPWDDVDPAMKVTLDGPESGTDASYHWIGNDKVGEGRMTITESVPSDKVGIRLEFIKPFASTCTTNFALQPNSEGTHVTWTMDGTNGFMMKAMGLFMNMDDMVGKDFDKGLASLKAIAEAEAAAPPDTTAVPGT
jgi:carbon monoxide dehydrogenase subunit G